MKRTNVFSCLIALLLIFCLNGVGKAQGQSKPGKDPKDGLKMKKADLYRPMGTATLPPDSTKLKKEKNAANTPDVTNSPAGENSSSADKKKTLSTSGNKQ